MTHYAWLQPTLERIADLLKMPDRHNSYATPNVDLFAALAAVRFITRMPVDAVTPTVIPTKAGGLLFEWSGAISACKVEFWPGVIVTATYKGENAVNLAEAIVFADHAMDEIRKELAALQR